MYSLGIKLITKPTRKNVSGTNGFTTYSAPAQCRQKQNKLSIFIINSNKKQGGHMDKSVNINDMQVVLWEQIQKVREGSTTPANCNAITNASGKILSTVKLQMEYCKLTGKNPEIDLFLPPKEKPEVKQSDESKIKAIGGK